MKDSHEFSSSTNELSDTFAVSNVRSAATLPDSNVKPGDTLDAPNTKASNTLPVSNIEAEAPLHVSNIKMKLQLLFLLHLSNLVETFPASDGDLRDHFNDLTIKPGYGFDDSEIK
jgi:hypothetical protein